MITASTTVFTTITSPVGSLLIAADDDGLRAVEFPDNRHPVRRDSGWREGSHATLRLATDQLGEYFAGRRTRFDLPLSPRGTPFQLRTWQALRGIGFGETISYAELARRIDQPSAMRAVGAANGRNPLPIVVPCHRVIGADGSLTGFGGGLPTKRFLLRLEGVAVDDDLFAQAS